MNFRSVICAAAILLIGATGAFAEQSLSNRDIIRNFGIVAFGNEYTKKKYKTIRKWHRPIRIGIVGQAPAYFDDMVIKFLDELISVTGHPMSLGYSARMVREKRVPEGADPRKLTNVSLIYHTINGIAEIIRGRQLPEAKFIIDHLYNGQAHCMATIRKKKSEIIRAMIFIPSHLSGFDMRGCIVEEMTQILGLPNDSNKITQSIFKDRGRYTELTQILGLTNDDDRVKQSIFVDTNRYDQLDKGLTPQDRLMLRLLYNPRMKPGTPRGQALKLATEILTKLRPGGAIR